VSRINFWAVIFPVVTCTDRHTQRQRKRYRFSRA